MYLEKKNQTSVGNKGMKKMQAVNPLFPDLCNEQ